MASREELILFGNHIAMLNKMKVGNAFTLYFFGEVQPVNVVHCEHGFYFNEEYVGNIYGAIKAYKV